MGSLSEIIVTKLHFIILLLGALKYWSSFSDFQEKKASLLIQKSTLSTQKVKLEKKIKDAAKYQENLDKQKRINKDIEEQIREAQKKLPNNINDANVLAMISDEMVNVKLRDSKKKSGEEVEKGFYFSKAYDIEGVGTWLQLLLFFESLNKKEQVFNVKRLSLKRGGRQKSRFVMLKMISTLEAFKYNPNYKSDVLTDEKSKTDPKVKTKPVRKKK